MLQFLLLTSIFLPIVMGPVLTYPLAGVISCQQNAGTTYADGYVLNADGSPQVQNVKVAFAFHDNPALAIIESGPHPGYTNWPTGYFSHIISSSGPRAGLWDFWIVDNNGARISKIVTFATDSVAADGKCQQAHLFFRKEK